MRFISTKVWETESSTETGRPGPTREETHHDQHPSDGPAYDDHAHPQNG